jgi:hypothetical protein
MKPDGSCLVGMKYSESIPSGRALLDPQHRHMAVGWFSTLFSSFDTISFMILIKKEGQIQSLG